jgi:hypothetical protein
MQKFNVVAALKISREVGDRDLTAKPFDIIGGARRNRTDDLFNAIEALSQLSYGPIHCFRRFRLGAKGVSSRGGGITAKARGRQDLG